MFLPAWFCKTAESKSPGRGRAVSAKFLPCRQAVQGLLLYAVWKKAPIGPVKSFGKDQELKKEK